VPLGTRVVDAHDGWAAPHYGREPAYR
jgi:hypothetical protein